MRVTPPTTPLTWAATPSLGTARAGIARPIRRAKSTSTTPKRSKRRACSDKASPRHQRRRGPLRSLTDGASSCRPPVKLPDPTGGCPTNRPRSGGRQLQSLVGQQPGTMAAERRPVSPNALLGSRQGRLSVEGSGDPVLFEHLKGEL